MKLDFDIKFRPQIESGEYTVYIKNYPVHILVWDSNIKDGCIVGYWGENENIYVWDKNGKHISSGNKENNLYIVTPDTEPSNALNDEVIKTFIIDTLGALRTSGKQLDYLINLDNAIEWLENLPVTNVFDFKIGDKVRLTDGDGRIHIIKSFERISGIHGPDFYSVTFEDDNAKDCIIPGDEYPNGYFTCMKKIEESEQKEDYFDNDIAIEYHTDEELDEFTENIRRLITKKLTYHSPDGTMSSTVFIDNETAKDIATGIWFYVAKECIKHPDKEIPRN